ncbi:ATP-binding protein [Planobispora siamensis]|uniref:histidine kinase n=1 Tax=Planobispora siamensis TaxID=936338 RepID=A0A8J3SMV9_9ACTN|nr:ATP-binding protein [Planobispora siamensis]GIH95496.1 hypothetical protein Psi01_61260 [Planobispora siamensis]
MRPAGAGGPGGDPDYARLFDAAPTPCVILDTDLVVAAVNRAYLAEFLTEREQIVGRPILDLFPGHPDDVSADGRANLARSLLTVLETGRPDTMALQRYDVRTGPDGPYEERYWSPVNTPVLDEAGRVRHIIHRVENVTEFVRLRRAGCRDRTDADRLERADRMESDLIARGRELQDLNQQLREANLRLSTAGRKLMEQQQGKDRFIATLSHELRNPLAAIQAAGELLALDISGHPALEVLRRQVEALTRIADDLLDSSQALSGGLRMVPEDLDLRSVVTAAVRDMRLEYAQAERRVETTVPQRPVPVRGDRVRLAQLLGNLLGNAVKYTRPGGEVDVELLCTEKEAILTVSDDGFGFDPATADSLFEMFTRPIAADSEDVPTGTVGLGLGLPIVRSIAELHGGAVSAHSDGPGTGARFSISLPLAPARHRPAAHRAGHPARHRNPLRVLVVEDNADLAFTYQELLERRGDTVVTAGTGREAVSAAREHRFDLVLCDLSLPDVSGHEVARRLLLLPSERLPPLIVAVSGLGRESDHSAALRAGFDVHLTKPVAISDLEDLLHRWTDRLPR